MSTTTREVALQIIKAHQFLYYVKAEPVISDMEYDNLCQMAGVDGKGGSDSAEDYPDHIKHLALQIHQNPAQAMITSVVTNPNLFGDDQPEPSPKPAAPEKPQPSKERIRGVVKVEMADEAYSVEMRASGVSVRRHRKKHVSHKSIQQIIDFVTEQPQLPFEYNVPGPEAPFKSDYDELLEYCVEYIACRAYDANCPGKKFARLKFAADALRAKVDELAPGMIVERMGKI